MAIDGQVLYIWDASSPDVVSHTTYRFLPPRSRSLIEVRGQICLMAIDGQVLYIWDASSPDVVSHTTYRFLPPRSRSLIEVKCQGH